MCDWARRGSSPSRRTIPGSRTSRPTRQVRRSTALRLGTKKWAPTALQGRPVALSCSPLHGLTCGIGPKPRPE